MSATDTDQQTEIEQLRARVAALEAELAEQAARAERAVAAAQERAYWLDRWHLDLNALMRKPGAAQFRALLRAARTVVRGLKKVKRTLVRGS
jgi:predicted  nucleic acid-binding Zn-ribbon protein